VWIPDFCPENLTIDLNNHCFLFFERRMKTPLIKEYPHQYEPRLRLKNGTGVFLRPVMPADSQLIVDMFNKMSPQSIYFRFLRNLSALPENMICKFTHVDYNSESALVAIIQEDGKDAIVAVGRYGYDSDEDITDLAVAVRDDWQHLGLGKSLLQKVVDIAKEHGISRFTCMMDSRNHKIKNILLALGYNVKYFPENGVSRVEIAV
jgi:acetyltransferase